MQPSTRRRGESLQEVRLRRIAAGGEHDVGGGPEELLRHLQADPAVCPTAAVTVNMSRVEHEVQLLLVVKDAPGDEPDGFCI